MKHSKRYDHWKRPVAFLLAITFLFSSFGFTVFAHYCPFKGSSLSFSPEEGCCCSKDIKTDDGCCKNKSYQVKIEAKYSTAKSLDFSIAKADVISLHHEVIEFTVPVIIEKRKQLHYSDTSPPGTSTPIFILDRSILI